MREFDNEEDIEIREALRILLEKAEKREHDDRSNALNSREDRSAIDTGENLGSLPE